MSMEQAEKRNFCQDGKEIDEYLAGTICEFEEEIEDITIPGDSDYDVHEPEEPETDDRYKDYL